MNIDKAFKDRARRKVRAAVLSGKLSRPLACDDCNRIPKLARDGRPTIHAHHHRGYHHPLDVRWLCPTCHFQYDKRPSQESNGRAVLTAEKVAEIRARWRPNPERNRKEGSLRGLGREYGVNARTILRIIQNEIWVDAALREEGR